ncbi:unnamed protein product [Microthlaspi erraticum]|uniref:Uncharacterized protein n=1 Tax=Microthlaspi erraticum TaxID=1685480 RepID=A0A6D2HZB4_9BRAS|nr:unnamed protein product [Microthlaspi erraticum]
MNLVRLYAKMGLHMYNLLQGTHLKLLFVKKYNKSESAHEEEYQRFDLTCSLARFKGKTNGGESEEEEVCYWGKYEEDNMLGDNDLSEFMPELPFEDPFKDDTNGFYMV